MCNIYGAIEEEEMESLLFLDDQLNWDQPIWPPIVGPRAQGLFIVQGRRPMVGQWGMIRPGQPERVARKQPRPAQKLGDIYKRISTFPHLANADSVGAMCSTST